MSSLTAGSGIFGLQAGEDVKMTMPEYDSKQRGRPFLDISRFITELEKDGEKMALTKIDLTENPSQAPRFSHGVRRQV